MTSRIHFLLSATFASSAYIAALPAQTAPSPQEEVVGLDRMDVEGDRGSGYGAALAQSSTKLAIPLLENSQNIQVVPRRVMEDQAALRLEDALRNVAGVSLGGLYSDFDYYRIRGFDASENTFTDGLREFNGMNEELFGLEQVEVVKGPASTLFGQAPLGGMVNIVSKRPVFSRSFTEIQGAAGSDHFLEASLDTNFLLGKNGTLAGRFLALYREHDYFVDYVGSERHFLAGSLSWKATPKTLITGYARMRKNIEEQAMPIPAEGSLLPNPNGKFPVDLYTSEPGRSNDVEEASYHLGYEIEHRVNDALTLRQHARFADVTQDWDNLLYNQGLAGDKRTLYRYPFNFHQVWHDLTVDTRAEFKLKTGPAQHTFAAGTDLYLHSYDYTSATINSLAGYSLFDIFNPVYGAPIAGTPARTIRASTWKMWGFYLQDHIRFDHGFTVSLGGRYAVSQTRSYRDTAFTPHVGVTWEFRPGISLFANRGESFTPQISGAITASGARVEPERGENYEVGLKTAAADGRLTATLAFYELTRQNVATDDPTTIDPRFRIVSGEQRSRGIELDGRLTPLPGLDVTLAYAYTDARITSDNELPVGARTFGVPLNSFSLWAKYTFQAGQLKGLGFALGQTYYTAQVGDSTYSRPFDLPPYGLTRVGVYYERGRFKYQLNIENLFDREYFPAAYSRDLVVPGAPRSFQLGVGYQF